MEMFAENAIYHSASAGECFGKQAIKDMIRTYCATLADGHWNISNCQLSQANTVRLSFQMTGTNRETNEPVERLDIEEIEFNNHGLICCVKVEHNLISD